MRVLVTLRRPGALGPVNLRVTADGTATVGDVAQAIASCAESGYQLSHGQSLTLRSYVSAKQHGRELSARMTLLNSSITSGSEIEVVPASSIGDSGREIAVLRVLEGPDRGAEVLLYPGPSTIGRAGACDVRLQDPLVSKRHAEILIADGMEIVDLNSANGVEIGGARVARSALASGETIRIGRSLIQVQLLRELIQAQGSTDIEFIRPPRVISRPRVAELEAPEVPGEPQPSPFPMLAMLAPLAFGVVMYLMTKSLVSVVFVALSPVMMLTTWISAKWAARKKRTQEAKTFRAAIAALDVRLERANDRQRTQLIEMFPSLDECLSAMGELGPLIWSRRPELPEFGQLRLGLGEVASVQRVEVDETKGRPDLRAELMQVVDARSALPQAPVVADLLESGSVGVAGETDAAAMVARGLVLQLAVTHSPTEVLIACLTSARAVGRWHWLEWLPHVNQAQSPLGDNALAADQGSARRILDLLDELIDSRTAAARAKPRGPLPLGAQTDRLQPVLPTIVVVVDDSAADVARLIRIAERGPDVGVHLVWLAPQVAALPAGCRTYVDVDSSTVGVVRQERIVTPLMCEGLTLDTALAAARGLAPVADAGALADDESDVPASVSMVTLLGEGMSDDPEQIIAHWQENGTLVDRGGPAKPRDTSLPLRALVGHTGIESFTLDLRSQGPHALVGGTTGAGKSEFLQAWILGLANAYSPDRLTFLLVDYKGGTAFAHCVKLPHCVGIVTDLSRHLVGRALRSLRAEIHHREVLLNEKQAKDLLELEMRGDPDCPPSLIIIVDEFAALKMEFPEFVDGMVDVAQRGRSLGLHLILATQRPAGVIGDNIRANTNLRIALRMNDEPDSKDIIDDVASAHIAPETPGRGIARVGPGRLRTFQSGYPGARTSPEPELAPVGLDAVSFGTREAWKVPRPIRTGPKPDRDIERIVSSVRAACERGAVPAPRRPWLQELSPVYDLLRLRQRRDDELVLGVLDDPDRQDQRVEYFRPDDDINLLVVGAGGSGKTTVLRTLALASAITPRTGPVHVYGMDFTGRGLVSLEVMPNVGSIVPGTDEERVARLLRTLDALITERGARYTAVNANSLAEYRLLADRPGEPRILVLLDGYTAFQEEYYIGMGKGHLFQMFQRLLTEGRGVGVHVVMTTERAGAVTAAVGAGFPRKLVLRLANEDAYLDVGVPKDALTAASPPGRAIVAPGHFEVQVACIGGAAGVADQVKQMEVLSAAVAPHHRSRPQPIRSLPALVKLADLPSSGRAVIGLSDATLAPLAAPMGGAVMVTGPRGSGKSNAMAVWATSLRRAEPVTRLVYLSAKRTPISALNLWADRAVGTDEVRRLLERLAGQLLPGAPGRPAVAVFCEGVPTLSDAGVGAELASLVRGLLDTDNLFVGEGQADGWGSAYEVAPMLKGEKQTLVLQMSGDDGFAIVDNRLPTLARADMVPGRGFWVDQLGAVKVQVPVHG